MEKYENLGLVGEGSYGMVMKCRHKETSQLVAIKKFLETENDKMVKKIALREVRMLKQLRHENLINLIEVFRRKKRLYLVFEFVDHTALDDLDKFPSGADETYVKKVMWQVLKGIEFCHQHNVIHRDVKPENILVSRRGVVKICDFGFARAIAPPGEVYTDYVATRWYRAPELLVGDTNYGKSVDIWAIGCLFSEMLTGEPLFPGESDIDQLFLITKCFGNLIARHREIFSRNPLFIGMRLPEAREIDPLERRYPRLSPASMDIIKWSLRLDPNDRPTSTQLLRHELFQRNGWSDKYTVELRTKIKQEFDENPLLKNLGITIYGSLYDMQHEKSEGTKSDGFGFSNGAEGLQSGADDSTKKDKKKKPKLHRDKVQHNSLVAQDVKPKALKTLPAQHALTGSPYGSQHNLLRTRSPYNPEALYKPTTPYNNKPTTPLVLRDQLSLEQVPSPPQSRRGSVILSPQSSLVDHQISLSRIKEQLNTELGSTHDLIHRGPPPLPIPIQTDIGSTHDLRKGPPPPRSRQNDIGSTHDMDMRRMPMALPPPPVRQTDVGLTHRVGPPPPPVRGPPPPPQIGSTHDLRRGPPPPPIPRQTDIGSTHDMRRMPMAPPPPPVRQTDVLTHRVGPPPPPVRGPPPPPRMVDTIGLPYLSESSSSASQQLTRAPTYSQLHSNDTLLHSESRNNYAEQIPVTPNSRLRHTQEQTFSYKPPSPQRVQRTEGSGHPLFPSNY